MVTVRSHCIMGQTSFPLLRRFISIKYLPFVVKMGKCVFSNKWKANERFKAWIAADPKRSVLFVTRQSIFGAWATNVQCFLTNYFREVFGQAQRYLDWLCAFCCFVTSSCVVL